MIQNNKTHKEYNEICTICRINITYYIKYSNFLLTNHHNQCRNDELSAWFWLFSNSDNITIRIEQNKNCAQIKQN